MRMPTPRSVKKTLALLFTTNTLLLVIAAAAIFSYARRRDAQSMTHEIGGRIALELTRHVGDSDGGRAWLDDLSNGAGALGHVHSFCVWDDNRAVVLCSTNAHRPPLERPELPAGTIRARNIAPPPGAEANAAWRRIDFRTQTQRGPLVASFVLALPTAGEASWLDVWRVLAPLCALAAGLLLFCGWCVRQDVLRPLEVLSAAASTPGRITLPESVVERPDILGQIARSITDLHRDADAWKRRAQDVERQVDSKVAARTREITRELHDVKDALWKDPLTGLNSRRLYEERFAEIFQAQRDAGQDLSIILIDVDQFKHFNDLFGHPAGDELLRFVGVLLRQFVREEDLTIRMGGDEFLVMLAGVQAKHADALAGRLGRLFDQYTSVLDGVDPKPGLSAGVASIATDAPAGPAELIEIADRRMYDAKKNKPTRSARRRTVPLTTGAPAAPSTASIS